VRLHQSLHHSPGIAAMSWKPAAFAPFESGTRRRCPASRIVLSFEACRQRNRLAWFEQLPVRKVAELLIVSLNVLVDTDHPRVAVIGSAHPRASRRLFPFGFRWQAITVTC